MVTAREFETAIPPAETDAEPQGEFEIRPRGWIKRVLPRTMFGRSLLIFIVPLVVLQAIATWVFYDRHWAAISWRLAAGVAGDIALLIEALQNAGSDANAAQLLRKAAAATDLDLKVSAGEKLAGQLPAAGTLLEDQLTQAMRGRVSLPYRIETLGDPYAVQIDVQLSGRSAHSQRSA